MPSRHIFSPRKSSLGLRNRDSYSRVFGASRAWRKFSAASNRVKGPRCLPFQDAALLYEQNSPEQNSPPKALLDGSVQ